LAFLKSDQAEVSLWEDGRLTARTVASLAKEAGQHLAGQAGQEG
jgi:hypothetical protein